MGRGHVQVSPEVCDRLWARLSTGMAAKPDARELGMSPSAVRAYLVRRGGVPPVARRRARAGCAWPSGRRSPAAWLRMNAARLGRAPSTISREVARNGGRARYRAVVADRVAWSRVGRPKACKLATHRVLRDIAEAKLQAR